MVSSVPWTRLLLAAVVATANISGTSAEGVAKRTTVQITSPSSLQKEGGYEHLEAQFGIYPRRGVTIEANLIYVDSELCETVSPVGYDDDLVDDDDNSGDDDDAKDEGSAEDHVAPDDEPISVVQAESLPPLYSNSIVMVDRGSCTFVKKVRNAQRLGAIAVIIADNVCLCSDPDPDCIGSGVCETSPPILADDGSGDDVTIPSFLLWKKDADRIKDATSSVTMKLSWAPGGVAETVEYSLWTVPHGESSSRFVLSFFSDFAVALGDRAKFTPHHYIEDGIRAGCRSPDGENVCYNLCTNNGRYCAVDPDDNLDEGISGADIVIESLRRLCIRDIYRDRDLSGTLWWNYTINFANWCDTDDFFMNSDCVKDCMVHSGINYTAVEFCMKQSGGTDGDVSNSLLDNEIFYGNELGIASVGMPALVVDDYPVRGQFPDRLTPILAFDAICGDYLAGSEPEICRTCRDRTDVAQCVSNGSAERPSTLGDMVADGLGDVAGGMGMPTVSSTLVPVGILSGLALCLGLV